VCDICYRDTKSSTSIVFCERCQPFAEQYVGELSKVIVEARKTMERTVESFRNKFMREIVIPKTQEPKRLEAVK
jgi:uncharacterized coiled-coil protein SlyX